MHPLFAQTQEVVTTTTGVFYQWIDQPLAVAMIFGVAGAFFIGIYLLRRKRK